jgi:hypothetical protein
LRRSSPSSRSASSSSASRFFGLGQTIGLDLLSLDKQRSRVTAAFRLSSDRDHMPIRVYSKCLRHVAATALLRLYAAVMVMRTGLRSSQQFGKGERPVAQASRRRRP